jgi:putative ABC transport system ATP-binding protein
MVTHSSYDAGFASRIINMKDGEIFNEQISDRTKDYFEKSQEDLAL